MTYSPEIRRGQQPTFDQAISACNGDMRRVLEVSLSYQDPSIPQTDYALDIAIALKRLGKSAPSAVRSAGLTEQSFPRFVHGCAVLSEIGSPNDSNKLLRGYRPAAVKAALQAELRGVDSSQMIQQDVRRYHSTVLVTQAQKLGHKLEIPEKTSIMSKTVGRVVIPLSASIIMGFASPTTAAAEGTGTSTTATAQPSAPTQRPQGGQQVQVKKDKVQPKVETLPTGAPTATPTVEVTPTAPAAEITPSATPSETATALPSAEVTPAPAATPSEQSTPGSTSVAPTSSASATQTPAPGNTTPPAPVEKPRFDPRPDPNVLITDGSASFPTGSIAIEPFESYVQGLMPDGKAEVKVNTAVMTAAVVAEVSGSAFSASEAVGASVAVGREVMSEVPFVKGLLDGKDVPSSGAQNPTPEVTKRVAEGIKAMTDNPALPRTFMQRIRSALSGSGNSQNNRGNNEQSPSTPEAGTNKELQLKAIENLGARGVNWKNRAQILKMFVEAGYTPANGFAFAGRPVIETGSVVVDPATKQYHDGPGRGPWQHGSYNRPYDRFGHVQKADGTYDRGTLMWFAQKNGGKWYELNTSGKFVLWELKNTYKRVGKLLNKAGNDVHKSAIAVLEFELPGSYLHGGKSKAATIKATYEQAQDIEKAYNEEYQKLVGTSSNETSNDNLPKAFTPKLENTIAGLNRTEPEKKFVESFVSTLIQYSDKYSSPVAQNSRLDGDSDFLRALKKYGFETKRNVFGAAKYDCKIAIDVAFWENGYLDVGKGTVGGQYRRLNTDEMYNQIVREMDPGTKTVSFGNLTFDVLYDVKRENLQPGDLLLTKGHIFAWTGPVKGKGGRTFYAYEAARGSERAPSFREGTSEYNWIKGHAARVNAHLMILRMSKADSAAN